MDGKKELQKTSENPFVHKFELFLKAQYMKQIIQLVQNYPEKRSLEMDFKEIEHYDPELADELLVTPDYVLAAAEQALASADVPALEIEDFKPHIRIFNLPKDVEPILRDIGAKHLGKLISVEGIVRMMTEVMPKLKTATWECKRCGNTYRIIQSSQQARKPAICECKNRDFDLVEEQSEFIDIQKVQIQEPLELLKGSAQPTNLDIYLSDDLVNKIAPGDRTRIIGVLRLYAPKGRTVVYGRYLEAIHLEETAKEFEEVEISKEEEEEIKKLAKNPRIYDLLAASIAPAIYGHDQIKEAITLQLFGGIKKLLPAEMQIRGNIHVLLVGEPGMAKCVSGDTRILLADGTTQKISDLVESTITNKSNLLSDGFYDSATYQLPIMDENCKFKIGGAIRVWKRKPDEMYLVKTRAGAELKVTNTHPLFVCNGGKVRAKRTADIKPGEFIAAPRKLGFEGIKQKLEKVPKGKTNAVHIKMPAEVTPEFARFVGYLLAEGYTKSAKTSKHIRFVNADKEVLDDFCFCVKKLFNRKIASRERKGSIEVIIDSIELGRFLDKNVPEMMAGSRERHIPAKIIKSGNKIVKEFLRAFFEAESSPRKAHRFIEITSASEKLINELKTLLLRNKIVAVKKEIFNRATNSKMKEKRKYFKLRFGGEFAKKFVKEIGYVTKRKRKICEEVILGSTITNTNIDVVPNLQNELKTLRQYFGLYQRQMGVNRGAYEHYEHGNRNPSRGQLAKIASHLLAKYVNSKTENSEIRDKILNLVKLSEADIFWDRVEEVKKIGCDDWVYDLEVDGTHNFITNLVFSHNSQLLQAVDKIAPKSIYTAGKTTTGAGITATAVKDEFGEGGWTIKAGALVLASGGIALIDELDKMDSDERFALHESMEQQCISIAKAGIVTRFRTETSILAAANPKYSRFDPYQNYMEQINLPPTLMSRFDLFFLIRDVLDRKKDEAIATHIMKAHQVGEMMRKESHGEKIKNKAIEALKKKITPPIEIELLRKYLSYARQNIFPSLSDNGIKQLTEFYVNLRDQGRQEGAYTATHRQLEALVRLSEASAKVRLSGTIEKQDIERAIRIFRKSLTELVTDVETGRPDIDIITSGQTHTQLTNLKKVLGIIKSKAESVDMVPREEVVEDAKLEGISEDKVYELISKLKKNGDIYEPRIGCLKPTTRK